MKNSIRKLNPFGRKPTFLLGVGCQKGGTSWLHNYLTSHPQTDMGFRKEYHVFDALYVDECRNFYQELVDQVRNLVYKDSFLESRECENALKRLDFYRNTDNYFDYFQFLSLRSPRIALVGDITPSYSALPVEALAHIRKELVSRGFLPRVVFLMRDPVERCWSAIRMNRKNILRNTPKNRSLPEESEMVASEFSGAQFTIRTRYDLTVARLREVFEPDELLFEFYERLFEYSSIKRISNFLGLRYVEPDFDKKVNVSKKEAGLGEALEGKIAEHYRPVYEWAFQEYGEGVIRRLWGSASYIR